MLNQAMIDVFFSQYDTVFFNNIIGEFGHEIYWKICLVY